MILITGGGGFIALNLAHYLVSQGKKVLLVQRRAIPLPAFLAPFAGDKVSILQGDVTAPQFLHSAIRDYEVESIVHAAVATETSQGSSLYQAVTTNVQGTAEILEASRQFGLRRVTFLSSLAVYFPLTRSAAVLSEDADLPVLPGEWIGATKKAAEQVCLLYANEYGLSVPIVRPPQVWGPLYWTHRSPVHSLIENAVAGKPTILPEVDGESCAPYIYVRDCARAIGLIHLAPNLRWPIYNIGETQTRSLADFARAIKMVMSTATIELGKPGMEPVPDRPPLDTKRLFSDTGFQPEYTMEQAVRAYILWLRDATYV